MMRRLGILLFMRGVIVEVIGNTPRMSLYLVVLKQASKRFFSASKFFCRDRSSVNYREAINTFLKATLKSSRLNSLCVDRHTNERIVSAPSDNPSSNPQGGGVNILKSDDHL